MLVRRNIWNLMFCIERNLRLNRLIRSQELLPWPDMLCVMLWQQRSDLDVKNGPFPASFYLFSSFQFSFE